MARPFSAGRTSWFPRSGSILTGQLCHATANNARHALRPPASRTLCGIGHGVIIEECPVICDVRVPFFELRSTC